MAICTETREVTPFTRLSFAGVGDLTITQGEEVSLVIEADDEVLPEIRSEVRGGTLHIGYKPIGILKMLFQSGKPIKIRLTMVEIAEINSSGAGNVYAPAIRSPQLDLHTSGVGNITVDRLEVERLSISISGTGSVTLKGQAREQKLSLSGVGSYRAGDLQSEQGVVHISGTGSAVLWTTEALEISLSGVGSLEYYGNPRVKQHVSGIGHVNGRGNR
jgi:hypothetical protein